MAVARLLHQEPLNFESEVPSFHPVTKHQVDDNWNSRCHVGMQTLAPKNTVVWKHCLDSSTLTQPAGLREWSSQRWRFQPPWIFTSECLLAFQFAQCSTSVPQKKTVKSRHDEHDANDVDHTLADLIMSSHAPEMPWLVSSKRTAAKMLPRRAMVPKRRAFLAWKLPWEMKIFRKNQAQIRHEFEV